jgi:uncharacterized pyridoxamine 5'-phosphate oxidase family protein
MKKAGVILFICIYFAASGSGTPGALQQRTNMQKQKIKPPFQGKKFFCSSDNKEKYTVIIKGNDVTFIIEKRKITGVFKNGKLFTNDPEEAQYRRIAGKRHYGEFYSLGADYLSILNSENGEYLYYTICE